MAMWQRSVQHHIKMNAQAIESKRAIVHQTNQELISLIIIIFMFHVL